MNNLNFIWDPMKILYRNACLKSELEYAILILNTKLDFKPEFLVPLWTNAFLKCTIDGGTNRWYKWFQENKLNSSSIPSPDFVSGDMDSIDPDVLDVIKGHPTISLIVTQDQSETDFTKAIKEVNKMCISRNRKIQNIIAVVDTGGRLDHIMANINTMFKAFTICPDVNIFQLASSSLSWLLHKGKHKIFIPEILRSNETWCALIPIGEKCDNITTTGLKWNLKNNTLKFGGLVSTSNTYSDQPFVTIETDKSLLWSMGLTGLSFSLHT